MESTLIRLTINPRKIAWLKFVLDGYEGLALLRTLNAEEGRVVLLVGPGAEGEAAGLVSSMKKELGLIEGLSDHIPETGESGNRQDSQRNKEGKYGQK
ncbi:MAG: DUF4911 domain-containing protein [Thermodesulfobacteriota bacterium]|nr:DUF4911 domain-containing protein [Thermodesulfobacteriota bacterium]